MCVCGGGNKIEVMNFKTKTRRNIWDTLEEERKGEGMQLYYNLKKEMEKKILIMRTYHSSCSQSIIIELTPTSASSRYQMDYLN